MPLNYTFNFKCPPMFCLRSDNFPALSHFPDFLPPFSPLFTDVFSEGRRTLSTSLVLWSEVRQNGQRFCHVSIFDICFKNVYDKS